METYLDGYFDNDHAKLYSELAIMLDQKTFELRKVQIDICANLNQYHEGAQVMLDLKKLFMLTGDFSDIEKIIKSVRMC